MKIQESIQWFKKSFKSELEKAVKNTPYNVDLFCAIAFQETGYIWNKLIKQGASKESILLSCVGDTLDTPKRKAFPINKKALIDVKNGNIMFEIARKALVDLAKINDGYKDAVKNENKFCHGYGIFQYDLQHFKTNPTFFLNKQWGDINKVFEIFVLELNAARKRQNLDKKETLSDMELVLIAIAYNKGVATPNKGLKQGYFDGVKFYGEYINEYYFLSKKIEIDNNEEVVPNNNSAPLPPPTPVAPQKKTYKVKVNSNQLNIRKTPDSITNKNILATLPNGHLVNYISTSENSKWYLVETSLKGAFLKGYVSKDYLELVKNEPIIVEQPNINAPIFPAVYMPTGGDELVKRTNIAGAKTIKEPNMPRRKGSIPSELSASIIDIINWLDSENINHRRYLPREGSTFCNIYAHDFCHLSNVYIPRVWWSQSAILDISRGKKIEPLLGNTIHEMRANDIYRWFVDFGLTFGWRRTGDITKLQNAANLGGVGVIIARRKEEGRSGHVVIVAPENSNLKAKRDNIGNVLIPVQSQAGTVNFKFKTTLAEWWKDEKFAEFAFWIHE